MALTEGDVAKIAHLARIKISEQEALGVTQNLINILGLVDQMQAVDTSSIEPMAHPQDATQPLRPDEVTETNHRDKYQKIAPAVEDGLYLVPKVID